MTPRGETTVAYAGEALRATRYDLSLQGRDISLWYGLQDQRWLALETPAEGGRLLRYEPVRLPTLSIADGAEDTRGR